MNQIQSQDLQSASYNLQWQKMGGLIPAIIQQADSGAVLMLGYMNQQALTLTQQSGRVHFWSRSRNELWLKGEKSGNYLLVEELKADCDGDALLVRVREATSATPVCHTGTASCFNISLKVGEWDGAYTVPHPAQPGNQTQALTLAQHAALDNLFGVISRLMSTGGCPWDMEQTHESLKSNLLEETYEALDALDALSIEDDIPREKKLAKVSDELGDLLGQIFYQAYIGERDGEFSLSDVASAMTDKLVRRHPHVFATTQVRDVEEVLANWEEIKKAERAAEGGDKSVSGGLRGIPQAMPALHYAQQVQGRIKRSGYVWPSRAELLAELRGKLAAIEAGDPDVITVGELLWQMVALARSNKVNAEEALRLAVRKFVAAYHG